MRRTVELGGCSQARGRNGWFVARTLEVYRQLIEVSQPGNTFIFGADVTLDISSKSLFRNVAPIHLELSAQDARRLRDTLTEVIEA